MSHQTSKNINVPGYEEHGTIIITYEIPKGTQGPTHPHPGHQFTSKTYNAYLPDSPEGREILSLLKRAFDAKLVFTIGKSDTVTWSDIEHKTSIDGDLKK